jgi:hypothetical protein
MHAVCERVLGFESPLILVEGQSLIGCNDNGIHCLHRESHLSIMSTRETYTQQRLTTSTRAASIP